MYFFNCECYRMFEACQSDFLICNKWRTFFLFGFLWYSAYVSLNVCSSWWRCHKYFFMVTCNISWISYVWLWILLGDFSHTSSEYMLFVSFPRHTIYQLLFQVPIICWNSHCFQYIISCFLEQCYVILSTFKPYWVNIINKFNHIVGRF